MVRRRRWLFLISAVPLCLPALAIETCSEINVFLKERQIVFLHGTRLTPGADVIDIGRGGLRKKRSMDDCVTPVGTFTVDAILSPNPQYNKISERLRERYLRSAEFGPYVRSPEGLAKLFENMDKLDFNHDGKPDHAYGAGYVALDGPQSGPKLQTFGKTPYWHSIAIHGTPDGASHGTASSGGCVHVSAHTLSVLLPAVRIGTPVHIYDHHIAPETAPTAQHGGSQR